MQFGSIQVARRRAVAGMVMFKSMADQLIAEGVEKMIFAVMARPEQSAGFCNQLAIGGKIFELMSSAGSFSVTMSITCRGDSEGVVNSIRR